MRASLIARSWPLLAAIAFFTAPAAAQHAPLPPEVVRLWRHAYDTTYRNANGNVYRKSRHADPFRNPFRSSRHYQRKLAAADDGYPVRTFIRYGRETTRVHGRHRGRRGARQAVTWDYAHHNGRFASPYDSGFAQPVPDAAWRAAPSVERGCAEPQRWLRRDREPQIEQRVEAAPPPVVRRSPVLEHAVIRTVKRGDGTTATIIDSVPIERPLDPAWEQLRAGDAEAATAAFAEHLFDETRGAEATAGYALAAARRGQIGAAREALRRALQQEPAVLSTRPPDGELRRELQRMADELDAEDDEEADAED